MPTKDPSNYSIITYAWVFAISCTSGLVHFINLPIKDMPVKQIIINLLINIITSAFVGTLTFYLCEFNEIPPLLAAPIIGICAHMGSDLLIISQTALIKIIKTKMGITK